MAKQKYFVVQPFEIATRGKIAPGEPLLVKGEAHAVRLAYRMEPKVAGVIAFSRVGDAELGEFDDPVIFCRLGAVPEELLEEQQAASEALPPFQELN